MRKIVYVLWILFLFSAPGAASAGDTTDGRIALGAILENSNRFWGSVKNYSAVFYKQELTHGKMGSSEKIFLKFEKPFKIFMGWLNTKKKGLQVVYERGKHDGKLAIHQPGLAFGLVPVIFLDPNSPWAREGSEAYDIEDAGIGTFLEDFTKAVTQARREDKLKVNFLNSRLGDGGRTAEVVFDDPDRSPVYFAHRVIVSFDAQTGLPVRMELFDWNNQCTGNYVYEDLKINLPSEDTEFKKLSNRQLYKIWRQDDKRQVDKMTRDK